jgi:exo-beta-1,3-glucanase (GH17 family)
MGCRTRRTDSASTSVRALCTAGLTFACLCPLLTVTSQIHLRPTPRSNRVCPPFDNVGQICLLDDQVKADMRTISSITTRVKLYSILCYSATRVVLDYAQAHGMKVNLGVWVQKDDSANRRELARFERLYPLYAASGIISDVTVGNEAVLVQKAGVDQLLASIRAVKAIVAQTGGTARVGSAEIENVWKGISVDSESVGGRIDAVDMTKVVRELDWIGVNSHPVYASFDPTDGLAGEFVRSVQKSVEQFWDRKGVAIPVYITETGYPSAGQANAIGNRTATPSLKGLETFLKDMEIVARRDQLVVCKSLSLPRIFLVLIANIYHESDLFPVYRFSDRFYSQTTSSL